ncbi:unnamed protein product [Trichogramma brassicae]|uniref:Uncharacterized protein n=1 Tax=Trichogramma brassicae TaxID=86971 RepID=A0A6H5IFD6_9HYME|nr:unnamed protein product [Trichogramma brassicae]
MSMLIATKARGLKATEPRQTRPQVTFFNVPGPDVKDKAVDASILATSECDCTDEISSARESVQRNGKFTVVLDVSPEAREILLRRKRLPI